MSTIIQVENLGKKYIISHQSGEPYLTIRDVLAKKLNLMNFFTDRQQESNALEEFWALKDVSFEVNEGDRIGIIGRNGAGKSTLLKLLCKITEPTEGKIKLKGLVSSLLEVGTGFHPELTGRENIFLNGAVLGMKKAEIKRKFDEIIAFAEIERFLDTPVKRYSSGMYIRLAFAVAAHLEPEILIVDEVLAVGDIQFQQKCLGKMEAVGKEGRTVLFVSHNLAAIKALCNKGILLDSGLIKFQGDMSKICDIYTEKIMLETTTTPLVDRKRPSDCLMYAKITDIDLSSPSGQINLENFDSLKPFTVTLTINSDVEVNNDDIDVEIYLKDDNCQMLTYFVSDNSNTLFPLQKGINKIRCLIEPLNVTAGKFIVGCGIYSIAKRRYIDRIEEACVINVPSFDPFGTGTNLINKHVKYFVKHTWEKVSISG